MASNSFGKIEYRELNQSVREIRLLEVLPAPFEEIVETRLIYKALDENPTYDALSYTWGDPKITGLILINGNEFQATSNLEMALRYLRLADQSRILWVDAICIDQGNIKERNQQVGMMRDIYVAAQTVRTWIGQEYEECDRDPRTEFTPEKTDWPLEKLLSVFGKEKDLEMSVTEGLQKMSIVRTWLKFAAILRRPYWRRVWIQQEVICAQSITIHCGSTILDLAQIRYAIINMRVAAFSPGYEYNQIILRVVVAGSYVLDLCTLQDILKKLPSFGQAHLHLLRSQLHRFATDPRDKIYALKGLINEWDKEGMTVNYEWTERQVYIETIRNLLRDWGSLDFLCHLPCLPLDLRKDMPSWCPNFGLSIDLSTSPPLHARPPSQFASFGGYEYAASQKANSEAYLSSCESALHASGFILDTILDVISPTDDVRWIRNQGAQRSKIEAMAGPENGSAYPDRIEALWRTLLANRIRDPTNNNNYSWAPAYFGHMYSLIGNGMTTPESLPSTVPEHFRPSPGLPPSDYTHAYTLPFVTNCGAASSQRCFFKSSKGYFGLASIDAKPGDKVCVIIGMKVPVIIRNFKDGQNEGFILISDAYFHGWMDGEAIERFESGHLKKEELVLY
ncbi:hypothetical protein BP6252_12533 [Coleophoma cylindrospora]|uniref:Heterokaryon incompatibility domain-containing protein n=1 Tax=Coleophoma cylindrospora TaxID=1849047 RepID=A0A3D8QC61_9HELO|nr:hypothetical protein BP6252_12533 [Coleophoma cylindrospora]